MSCSLLPRPTPLFWWLELPEPPCWRTAHQAVITHIVGKENSLVSLRSQAMMRLGRALCLHRIPLGTHQGEGGDLLNSPRLLLLRENSSGQPHALRSPPSTRPHPGQHCGTHAHIGNYHTTATTKYLDTLRDFPSRVTALRKLPRVCSRVSELQ